MYLQWLCSIGEFIDRSLFPFVQILANFLMEADSPGFSVFSTLGLFVSRFLFKGKESLLFNILVAYCLEIQQILCKIKLVLYINKTYNNGCYHFPLLGTL